ISTTLKRFRRTDGKDVKTIAYEDLYREQGRTINVDEVNEGIHVSKRDHDETIDDNKDIKIINYINIELDVGNDADGADAGVEVKELTSLLPKVIEALKVSGKLEECMAFYRLITAGIFPMYSIAFLLCLDVVR
ncbi:hypothetical protein MAR_016074, partial [Mya arenaria]